MILFNGGNIWWIWNNAKRPRRLHNPFPSILKAYHISSLFYLGWEKLFLKYNIIRWKSYCKSGWWFWLQNCFRNWSIFPLLVSYISDIFARRKVLFRNQSDKGLFIKNRGQQTQLQEIWSGFYRWEIGMRIL